MVIREMILFLSTAGIAEVVGSNPTWSTFIILVKYGIVLSLILIVGGQKASLYLHNPH